MEEADGSRLRRKFGFGRSKRVGVEKDDEVGITKSLKPTIMVPQAVIALSARRTPVFCTVTSVSRNL